MTPCIQDLIDHAKRLVQENPRHSDESLFAALDRDFPERDHPELTQEHIEEAVKAAF